MSVTPETEALTKLQFLRLMMLSREGDRREGILLRQSKGWFQVSGMGHEALAGLALPLRPDDWVFPYYRDRALMLARGMSDYELALAYFAKRESSSGGRQMPGHYSSRKLNVFSVATPTGSTLLPACGTAWAMQLQGKDSVALATLGDAASRQGEYYEALAFAVQENLPVIFVLEDNKFGISTPTEHFLAYNLEGILSLDRVVRFDARRLDHVVEAATAAVQRARDGQGPTVLWADLDRLSSHTSSDDHRVYRAKEDIEAMAERDPIRLLTEELMANGTLSEADLLKLQEEVAAEVDADYLRAERAQDPSPEEVLDHTFGPEPVALRPPIESGPMTMVEAINRTFAKALENDPNIVFFGEDIEDPKGGVFGLTKGLSAAFPSQVHNSPLAEATILGVAVGMAAYGMRPLFELQFIDFIGPAWNQVTANVGTLRWRTFGDFTLPMVVYAPYGAYLPGGSLWHSQSNEAALAHVPGIRVAIPSTPEDAAGLFWTAIRSDDPTFILVPKHIFRKRMDVPQADPVPFGKLRVRREGTDVTVVAYGNCLELAEEAAAKLSQECSVEILDLRSIVPLDLAGIARSLEKTGRLVVIQEDNRTCGFGQAVLAEIVANPDTFGLLFAAPQLVARVDTPIGYNPTYEYAALPDVAQVIAAIRATLS